MHREIRYKNLYELVSPETAHTLCTHTQSLVPAGAGGDSIKFSLALSTAALAAGYMVMTSVL